jgi:hypothetical protein
MQGENAMTEILHGLVSGLSWSATLAICLIAIAFVVTATVSASAGMPSRPSGTPRAGDTSPIPDRGAPGPDRDASRSAARPAA